MQQIIPGFYRIDEIGDAVHCYLWEWDGGVTLIDTGFPRDARTILDALRDNGYPLHSVKRIIITHIDSDHIGSAAALKRATGAVVACHTVEKQYLENPGRRQPANWLLRPLFWVAAGLMPRLLRASPVPVDELYVDGQITPEGFTVIHTPGHTPGHISLLHKSKRVLIAGDALSNRDGNLQSATGPFTPDEHNAQRSIWKLAKKYGDDFEVVAFGHGPTLFQNGGKRVKGLASRIFSQEI